MTQAGIDHTHDISAICWVDGVNGHPDFPVQNLPFGIFSLNGGPATVGVAIGDHIVGLAGLVDAGLLVEPIPEVLRADTLNRLMSLPSGARLAVRHRLFDLLTDERNRQQVLPHLHPMTRCVMHLPAAIGDYTDFYVSIHHANNVGALFRPDAPLLPNYKYVPIGYHGRASSIRPSGVPLVRPKGQRKEADCATPVFGPTTRLDYELELGIWIGQQSALGEPIPIAGAADHIAGFCLLNDWSARDFQTWEYQPLGPFLAKNFQSTISPWVITAEALAPYRIAQCARPEDDPAPLPYLFDPADQATGGLAITLAASLSSKRMREAGMAPHRLGAGPASNMYWTAAQIVTHHASNGCNLNPGDLLGTGTISGPTEDSYGSLLELTSGGKAQFVLPSGEARTFVEDGDEIALAATAHADGFVSIGFGECRALVLPAK